MIKIIAETTNPDGVTEIYQEIEVIEDGSGDLREYLADLQQDLHTISLIDWTIYVLQDGEEINRYVMQDSIDEQPIFYFLEYEGYRFNSTIRDNIDCVVHRKYKKRLAKQTNETE